VRKGVRTKLSVLLLILRQVKNLLYVRYATALTFRARRASRTRPKSLIPVGVGALDDPFMVTVCLVTGCRGRQPLPCMISPELQGSRFLPRQRKSRREYTNIYKASNHKVMSYTARSARRYDFAVAKVMI